MNQHPPIRPEYQRELAPLGDIQLEQPLPWAQRLWNFTPLRKTLLLLMLALLWEAGARWLSYDFRSERSVHHVIRTVKLQLNDCGETRGL